MEKGSRNKISSSSSSSSISIIIVMIIFITKLWVVILLSTTTAITTTTTTTTTKSWGWLLACLLNVPAICKCISGTDLLRQFYVLPH